jgi:hypothetical protein
MPFDYRIDHEQRLVVTRGHGALSERDFFSYQREVWSRPEVAGYSELIDMSDVGEVVEPSPDGVYALAELAARMDPPSGSGMLAIVAPRDVTFGLGRMYQAYREQSERSTKQVGVFRTLDEALRWLGGVRRPVKREE